MRVPTVVGNKDSIVVSTYLRPLEPQNPPYPRISTERTLGKTRNPSHPGGRNPEGNIGTCDRKKVLVST